VFTNWHRSVCGVQYYIHFPGHKVFTTYREIVSCYVFVVINVNSHPGKVHAIPHPSSTWNTMVYCFSVKLYEVHTRDGTRFCIGGFLCF